MDNGCKLFNKSKTVIIFIVITLSLIQCTRNTNIIRDDMVINGLALCQSYTQEQMIEALGQPDSIKHHDMDSGKVIIYHYNQDSFTIAANDNLLTDFKITTPRFKLNNFISVGDPVARVALLGGTVKDYVVTHNGENIKYKHWGLPSTKDYSSSIIFYYDSNNIITKIVAIFNSLY